MHVYWTVAGRPTAAAPPPPLPSDTEPTGQWVPCATVPTAWWPAGWRAQSRVGAGPAGCWSLEEPDTSDSGWAALWPDKGPRSYCWISTSRPGISQMELSSSRYGETGEETIGLLRGCWAAGCNRSRWVPGALLRQDSSLRFQHRSS